MPIIRITSRPPGGTVSALLASEIRGLPAAETVPSEIPASHLGHPCNDQQESKPPPHPSPARPERLLARPKTFSRERPASRTERPLLNSNRARQDWTLPDGGDRRASGAHKRGSADPETVPNHAPPPARRATASGSMPCGQTGFFYSGIGTKYCTLLRYYTISWNHAVSLRFFYDSS